MNTLRRAPKFMVKAAAAGAMLVAATLPLAVATEAGAATPPVATYLGLSGPPTNIPGAPGTAPQFGPGYAGTATFTISAADSASLANTSTSATISTTASGVSFGAGVESVTGGVTTVVASISSTSAVTTGFYPAVITDTNGTPLTVSNAFFINPQSTIASITPTTLPENDTGVAVTLTGTGFIPGATATLSLAGTTITNTAGGSVNPTATTLAYASSTTLTGTINTTALATGLYAASVANGDGGSATSATVGIAITGPTITTVAPASLSIPASGSVTTTITLTGTAFQPSAYVNLTASSGSPTASVGVATVVSATSITVPITVPSTSTVGQFTVIEHNPDGSSSSITGGLGIGEASSATATVTAVNTLPAMTNGASASLAITGTGFGSGSTSATVQFIDTAGVPDTGITCTNVVIVSDTSMNCIVNVISAKGGPHAVAVKAQGGTAFSTPLAGALTVNGPVITAVSPSAVPGSFNGVFTLTGTGFTAGTLTATATATTGTATAAPAYVSATSVTVTVSASSIVAGQTMIITLTDNGATTDIAVPVLSIPVLNTSAPLGVVYAGTTTGVGQAATAQPITFNGTGFLPGITVTFPAASGITATVKTVTSTVISATLAVSATTTTGLYPVTLTNTNGGTSTSATAVAEVNIDAGTGVLTVAPSAVLAGAKAATFTITSSTAGLKTGATVTAGSPLITVGTVTFVSGSAITVSLASAAVTGTVVVGTTLTVTNPDGGTASPAFSINPGPTVTGAYFVPTFSTNVEVNVTGTGFEQGMTATSSNAAYTVTVANVNASGFSLTLLVSTTSAASAGTNSNIVLTNPDGSAVTFVLNGGPAPKPAPKGPHAVRVVGSARAGKTVTITVLGSGFYGQPRIVTNARGTRATVSHDSGTSLTVRIFEAKNVKKGLHVMKITLANGKATNAKYTIK